VDLPVTDPESFAGPEIHPRRGEESVLWREQTSIRPRVVFQPSLFRRQHREPWGETLASGTAVTCACDEEGGSSDGLGVSFLRRGGAARRGTAGTGMEVSGL
jgi:hypothetical protein